MPLAGCGIRTRDHWHSNRSGVSLRFSFELVDSEAVVTPVLEQVIGRTVRSLRTEYACATEPEPSSAVARERARHSPARTRPNTAYKKIRDAHANIDRTRNGTLSRLTG
ncbi:unnamed protein product, partial [Brenthis ino]